MLKPDPFKNYISSLSPLDQAKAEIAYDKWRAEVEKEKTRILTYKPWYEKLFPYRINIQRIK